MAALTMKYIIFTLRPTGNMEGQASRMTVNKILAITMSLRNTALLISSVPLLCFIFLLIAITICKGVCETRCAPHHFAKVVFFLITRKNYREKYNLVVKMGTTLFAYSPSPINNRMRLSPVCGHTYLKVFDVIIASWNCGCFFVFWIFMRKTSHATLAVFAPL